MDQKELTITGSSLIVETLSSVLAFTKKSTVISRKSAIFLSTASRVVAIVNILMFLSELLILFFSDFNENSGSSKGLVIFSFLLSYAWLIIPPLIYLLLTDRMKGRKIVSWIFLLLNGAILIYNIPIFYVYMKGN